MSLENHSSTNRTIAQRIDDGAFESAIELLRAHGAELAESGYASHVSDSLNRLVAEGHSLPAELQLLWGQIYLSLGDLERALDALAEARVRLNEKGSPALELRCSLRLAQVYHRREALTTARLHTEDALRILRSHDDLAPELQADVYLGLARLAPDTGQLSQCIEFAEKALELYRDARVPTGQLDATILIAQGARQLGRYPMADSHLELARRQIEATPDLEPYYRVQLRNTIAHSAWYRADFDAAEKEIRCAIEVAAATNEFRLQIYNHLVLANILRARERIDEARQTYAESRAQSQAHSLNEFMVWIDANQAWLEVLQHNYIAARRLLFGVLSTADRGQAASFNAFLAGLYSLTERFADAEGLLRQSLDFYESSGDELSTTALRIHLAYLHIQTERAEHADEIIRSALGWGTRWNVDYFPHWWHPRIVGTVCARALAVGIEPGLAERMLVGRVGAMAADLLRPYLNTNAEPIRRRVSDVLALLDDDASPSIETEADPAVRGALDHLYANGLFRRENLSRLERRLKASPEQLRLNPVLLATFGLYMYGRNRREIAAQLGRSENTIRNYITQIYERFGLAQEGGSRLARRRKLERMAVKDGLVQKR